VSSTILVVRMLLHQSPYWGKSAGCLTERGKLKVWKNIAFEGT